MEFHPRILVVEADDALRRLLDEVLTEMGGQPRLLADGREAAALVNVEKFDGVFLDSHLAGLDGMELTRRIRRSKSNARVPIVMLSDAQDPESLAERFKAGVNFALEKPLSVSSLRHLLNASRGAMLEERRRTQRAPVRVRVNCRWGGLHSAGQSINISPSGLLVALEDAPAVGESLHVEFNLAGQPQSFELDTLVARVTPGPPPGEQTGHGVGLIFKGMAPRQRQWLTDFVARTLETLDTSA